MKAGTIHIAGTPPSACSHPFNTSDGWFKPLDIQLQTVRESGPASGFGYVYDLATGADGNLYVMQLTGSSWQIVVVPKTQNGPVQPVRTLLTGRYGMFVALGPTGTMYVPPTDTRETRVAVFAPGASGNAKPIGFVGKGDAAAGHVALENPWFLP